MWSRAFAALVPGFFLAAALTGLVCWLPPGPWRTALMPALIAFFPIWTGVAVAGFACASGTRAWRRLSAAAVFASVVFWALKTLQWMQ